MPEEIDVAIVARDEASKTLRAVTKEIDALGDESLDAERTVGAARREDPASEPQ